MTICPFCKKTDCLPTCTTRLRKKRVVVIATDIELGRKSHMRRLAIATRSLELSRREIPNWMADVIFGFEGDILWPSGDKYFIGDEGIDFAFNDDGSFRWLTDFLNFAEKEPKQKPQMRILQRLRLIDLAFRIAYPDRAELIAK